MERLVGDIPALGLRIKERIKKETGLTASVGLAPNKFLAKLASDLKKPNGLVIIRQSEAASRIAPLPISRIFGIGARSASLLTRFGIRTIGDLAACDASFLSPLFGKIRKPSYALPTVLTTVPSFLMKSVNPLAGN